jgi:hypothetical protein
MKRRTGGEKRGVHESKGTHVIWGEGGLSELSRPLLCVRPISFSNRTHLSALADEIYTITALFSIGAVV